MFWCLPNTDLGILRVKADDHGNLHCHKQDLTLVVCPGLESDLIAMDMYKLYCQCDLPRVQRKKSDCEAK